MDRKASSGHAHIPTGNRQHPQLRRALGLWDLILYGLIVIQPTAPMPVYGVMSTRSHGYAVITVLLAMVAMLFTAISYGKMASAYPSAGSAFTYVGREIHPALGYITGWSMAMDYVLNPLICTILCSKFAMNFFPEIPYAAMGDLLSSLCSHSLNMQGIQTSARINSGSRCGHGRGHSSVSWRPRLVTCTRHLMTESGSLPARFSIRRPFPSEPSWAGPRWPC